MYAFNPLTNQVNNVTFQFAKFNSLSELAWNPPYHENGSDR